MWCAACKLHPGGLPFGKNGSNNLRHDTLTKHEARSKHHLALKHWAKIQKRLAVAAEAKKQGLPPPVDFDPLRRSLTGWAKRNLLGMIQRGRMALYLATHKRPLSDYDDQIKLATQMKTPNMTLTQSDEEAPATLQYASHRQAEELTAALATWQRAQLKIERKQAQCHGLMLDESTDAGNLKQLIVIERHVVNGLPKSHFLGLLELPNGKARTVAAATLELLRDPEIEMDPGDVVGAATDGASVMTGHKGGE